MVDIGHINFLMNEKRNMNWIEQIPHLPQAKGKYSQFNEEAILLHIFKNIGEGNKFLVDIGAGAYDHGMSNSRLLIESGWKGIGFDGNPTDQTWIYPVMITPDNIVNKLIEYRSAVRPDFLNLDIDSSDYWVLTEVLQSFAPRVICTEFNGCLDPNVKAVLRYEKGYTWDGTDKYGYSFAAGKELLEYHGYTLIYNQHETNIFAVRNELIEGLAFPEVTAKRNQYHPHNPGNHWVKF